jgi:DNA-binding transcriptional MerR regulator
MQYAIFNWYFNNTTLYRRCGGKMQVSDETNADGGQTGSETAAKGKKMYYSISEACAMTGIEPHILRYWEKEFSLLRPKKNSGGKRAYKEKDIEAIVRIKHMLEDEKYTLQGAKSKLLDERRERRLGVDPINMRRRKTDFAESGTDGATPADSSASASGGATATAAMPLMSIPTDAFDKLTSREFVSIGNNGGGDGGGDNRAFIMGIRDELTDILGLLES